MNEGITLTGKITDVYPGGKFKVVCDVNGKDHEVLATVSGKLRINNIKITLGDRVDVSVSPYDLHSGRIVWRTK